MQIMLSIFIFVFGLIVGSFLNVVILRYHSGRNLGGRSFCFSCAKQLSWYELVPLFSFVFLKGKCRKCRNKISWQYPLVESLTGLIFLAVFLKFINLNLGFVSNFEFVISNLVTSIIFYWIIFSLLIVIAVYDLRHKIIPEEYVWGFVILSLGWLIFNSIGQGFVWSNFLAGPILAFPFAFLWLISKGRWMGLGDAKIALGLGFLLGLAQGFVALLISFWLGALMGLILLFLTRAQALILKHRKFTIKSEIPFAPFMIFGILIVFVFNLNLQSIINLFTF